MEDQLDVDDNERNRSGTQPNESGWRSGGAVSFPPTPTGMRNGADGPAPLGELPAATRLTRLQ